MGHESAVLFQPYDLAGLALKNRIVMAPLTRSRATAAGDEPNELHVEYYRQRAGAGLIVTEASQISPQGKGYLRTPGIYSPGQVAGWRRVTEAVHAAGGRIFIQLWHVGRISHPDHQPGGALPVAPSAVRPAGHSHTPLGSKAFVTPRALEREELGDIVEDFAQATRNALAAGFDGVEIHGANGYLIDQFLRDGTNRREDDYGGSVANRLRFPLQVVDAVVAVAGAGRVGIRLSPVSPANDMRDSDPEAVFHPLVVALDARGLAYVHVVEGATGGSRETAFDFAALRQRFAGAWMVNNGYTRELAAATLVAGRADLVAFGRPFISNPDLPERLRRGLPLAEPDRGTFYSHEAKGYTDYPALTAGR